MKTNVISISKTVTVYLFMVVIFLPATIKSERFPELFLKSPQEITSITIAKNNIQSKKSSFTFINPFKCNKKKLSAGFKAVLKNKKGSYINLFIGFEI